MLMTDSAQPFYWTERDAWYYYEKKPTGKRGRVYLADTQREAMKVWKRKLADAPKVAAPSKTSFRSVSAKWLERQVNRRDRGEVGADWVARVSRTVKSFDKDHPGIRCNQITPAMAREWKKGHSAAYEHTELNAIKQILKWAVDEGYLAASPLTSLALHRGNRRESLIDIEQQRQMAKLADRHLFNWSNAPTGLRIEWPESMRDRSSLRAMLWMLWWTGARPGELRCLQWEHMNEDCTSAVLRAHKTARSTGKPRVIYFNDLGAAILRQHRKASGPVFTTSRGNAWSKGELGRRLRTLAKKAGIVVTAYTYRHSFITRALLAGADIGLVAELTGTSIEMISRHYAHMEKAKPHLAGLANKLR